MWTTNNTEMRLGDKFPTKLLYVKKSALGVGLIEPETVMDYLAMKLCVGNERSKSDLTRVTNTHEEISEEDSGLPNKVIRNKGRLRHWNSGWIEELCKKLEDRRIEMVEDNRNTLVNTKNKFLMDHAMQCVNGEKMELNC